MVWIAGLWSGNHPPPIAFGVFSGDDGPAIKCTIYAAYAAASCYLVAKRRHLLRFREIEPVNGDSHFPAPFEKYMAGHCTAISLTCLFA